MSIQSSAVRGGIQGNEDVIGEDGGIGEESDDDEQSADKAKLSGICTRQSRLRGRKKPSADKAELMARTRNGGASNGQRQGEDSKQGDDGKN